MYSINTHAPSYDWKFDPSPSAANADVAAVLTVAIVEIPATIADRRDSIASLSLSMVSPTCKEEVEVKSRWFFVVEVEKAFLGDGIWNANDTSGIKMTDNMSDIDAAEETIVIKLRRENCRCSLLPNFGVTSLDWVYVSLCRWISFMSRYQSTPHYYSKKNAQRCSFHIISFHNGQIPFGRSDSHLFKMSLVS